MIETFFLTLLIYFFWWGKKAASAPPPARSLIEDYNNSSKSTKSLSLSLIEQFISPKDLFIQFSEDDFEVNLFIQLSYCIYYTKSLLESYQLDQFKYSPPPPLFSYTQKIGLIEI